MKLFGTKDPLSKLFDRLEQDKDLGLGKIILNAILDLMGYMLLFVILIITFPMLLPGIILVLLTKLLLFVLTALESSTPSQSGTQTKPTGYERYIRNSTLIRSDYGIRHSRKE